MDFLKNNYPAVSTGLFVTAIVFAQMVSTNNYDWTKHTISHLGSQGYDRKHIMQFGFLAFGLTLAAGVLLNGITWQATPILVYGLCVGLTGIFCAKPFFPYEAYSVRQAAIHSWLAQLAGLAFTLGVLGQLFSTPDKKEKFFHLIFFILVMGLSASFGLVKHYQGVFQRLLYGVSFLWLLKFYRH